MSNTKADSEGLNPNDFKINNYYFPYTKREKKLFKDRLFMMFKPFHKYEPGDFIVYVDPNDER